MTSSITVICFEKNDCASGVPKNTHLGRKTNNGTSCYLWKLKEMPAAEQETVKADIKAGPGVLFGWQIPGLTEIHVYTQLAQLRQCGPDVDTTFVDEAALKGYAVHSGPRMVVADGQSAPLYRRAHLPGFEVQQG